MAGRDEAALEKGRRSLGDVGQNAVAVRMDVTNPASIEAAERAMSERFGGVDVLVNNAAVLLAENREVLSIPPDDYRRTFEANVFGAIAVCRAFVPGMAKR